MALSEVASSAQCSQSNLLSRASLVSSDRIFQTHCRFIPLTAPYYDHFGRHIQLGKNDGNELLGRVVEREGITVIVPSNCIHNPLNPQESPERLLTRLERAPLGNWDLALDIHTWSLTIWPHLFAAGKGWLNHPLVTEKGRETREIRIQGSPLRYVENDSR